MGKQDPKGQEKVLEAVTARQPLKPVNPREISREYQTTIDLHGLYVKYRDSADPNALYFAYKSVDFCARYIPKNDRDIYSAAPEYLPSATAQQDMVNRSLFARCSGFKEFTPKSYWAEAKRLKKAVEEGQGNVTLAAKAAQLLTSNKSSEAANYARTVLLSKEPDAIEALEAYVVETQSPPQAQAEKIRAAELDGIAIRLAACSLGKECGKDALEMLSLCLYGGSCDDSLEAKTAKVLNNAEMQLVLKRRDTFVSAINNGDLKVFGL